MTNRVGYPAPLWCPYLNSRAFTLLELMVVMVLITIAMGFAIPQINNTLLSDPLKKTARKLAGLATETAQLAQRNQVEYFLRYDNREKTVKVEAGQPAVDKGDKNESNREFQLPDSVSITDLDSFYGGSRSSGDMTVRFSKQGYVDLTLIHLQEDGGDAMTVVLSPFLGRIKILDTNVELESDEIQ